MYITGPRDGLPVLLVVRTRTFALYANLHDATTVTAANRNAIDTGAGRRYRYDLCQPLHGTGRRLWLVFEYVHSIIAGNKKPDTKAEG